MILVIGDANVPPMQTSKINGKWISCCLCFIRLSISFILWLDLVGFDLIRFDIFVFYRHLYIFFSFFSVVLIVIKIIFLSFNTLMLTIHFVFQRRMACDKGVVVMFFSLHSSVLMTISGQSHWSIQHTIILRGLEISLSIADSHLSFTSSFVKVTRDMFLKVIKHAATSTAPASASATTTLNVILIWIFAIQRTYSFQHDLKLRVCLCVIVYTFIAWDWWQVFFGYVLLSYSFIIQSSSSWNL